MRTLIDEQAASRVLVVEDQPDIRSLVGALLYGKGYEVTGTSDGERALRLLGDSEFDLVILDVMMPKIDGYEVLRQMRISGALRSTAVLMLTALGSDRDWMKALRLGAHDYLPKPFDGEELIGISHRLLSMTATERSRSRQACLDRSHLLVQLEDAFELLDTS